MVTSYKPGESITMVRNPNYWMSGEPYLDEIDIIDFSDNTSRVAALLSGQVDFGVAGTGAIWRSLLSRGRPNSSNIIVSTGRLRALKLCSSALRTRA